MAFVRSPFAILLAHGLLLTHGLAPNLRAARRARRLRGWVPGVGVPRDLPVSHAAPAAELVVDDNGLQVSRPTLLKLRPPLPTPC